MNVMREWLSGRASPCQGECRGFESRFPLHQIQPHYFFILVERLRRYSQEVRPRSAKPSLPGSNPGGASKQKCLGLAKALFTSFSCLRPAGTKNFWQKESNTFLIIKTENLTKICYCGGIGRRKGLKSLFRPNKAQFTT